MYYTCVFVCVLKPFPGLSFLNSQGMTFIVCIFITNPYWTWK